MAITLVRALEMLGRATGVFFEGEASSGTTSTLVEDTKNLYHHDINTLKNKWLYITDATTTSIEDTARRISSVHASNGTITVDSVFQAATQDDDTYQILPYDPEIMKASLQQAARSLYPHIYLPTQDESIVVDNLVSNWDFETWSGGAATGWTTVSGTLAEETGFVLHGSSSAKLTNSSVTIDKITQNLIATSGANINETESKTLHVRGWIWSETADAVRLSVTFDGSTFNYSSYHSGTAEWEGPALIYIDVPIDYGSNEQITISCDVTGNAVIGYFDNVTAWIDNIHSYNLPSAVKRGPHKVSIQSHQSEPNGDYVPLSTPQSGRILRIEHMGTLTAPTYASSIELDESRGELLIAQAAAHMFQTLSMTDSGNSTIHIQNANMWQDRADRLLSQPGMRMKGMSAHERKSWRVVESGETRKLALSGRW